MFLVVTVKRVQFLVGQNSKIQSDIVSFIAWLPVTGVCSINSMIPFFILTLSLSILRVEI